MTGKTILRCKILEKLGEGGAYVFYKAEDTKLKRVVALKFISHKLLAGWDERSRVVNEAQATASLNRLGICAIYEMDEYDGHPAAGYFEGVKGSRR